VANPAIFPDRVGRQSVPAEIDIYTCPILIRYETTTMANPTLIDHLNEILKHEWTGVAQYSQAGFIIEGVWREVYADKFLSDAKESFGHARLVGDKIVALGGVPVATRNEIQQSRDLQEVFSFSLAFESKAVEMYSKAIELAGDDKPLVVFLEDILKEEQEGVDEYTKLLRNSGTAAANPALKSA
jgi:bacterioferritin